LRAESQGAAEAVAESFVSTVEQGEVQEIGAD